MIKEGDIMLRDQSIKGSCFILSLGIMVMPFSYYLAVAGYADKPAY